MLSKRLSKLLLGLCGKWGRRRIPDRLYLQLKYKATLGRDLRLDAPATFNEKLNWLKLHWRRPEFVRMVDKHSAKEFVKEIIGEEYVVPLYGVWEHFDDIDFSALPERFVLKTTHDSGGVCVCRGKAAFDRSAAREKLEKSLARDYYWGMREWAYKLVPHRIMAEKLIEGADGKSTMHDYKIYCFNGIPRVIQYSGNLDDHAKATHDWYDMAGVRLPLIHADYPRIGAAHLDFPTFYPELLDKVKKLLEHVDSPFVRIDFFVCDSVFYFSEITFFPSGGMHPFVPEEWDARMGEMLVLPAEPYKRVE